MMKIGVDISQIVYSGGVSVYTQNLFNNILKTDHKNKFIFFFSSLRQSLSMNQKDLFFAKNSKLKQFHFPQTALDFLWNKIHLLPIENLLGSIDIFHSSDWTQPPSKKAKLVTTIHDLSFLKHPNSVDPKVLMVQKRRLDWVKKEVDQIITVSQATKKEIINLLGVKADKIKVIYEALPDDVAKFKPDKKLLEKTKQRLNIKNNYLFAYGSSAPRKNIKKIISAFCSFNKNSDFQLIITGNYKPNNLPKNVIPAGFLPRAEMLNLFCQASAFIYPSLYEGFGLPILESFALSVPVVTSNCSSMSEIAQDSAVLVDPQSTNSIAQGIKKALSNKTNLIKKGQKRLIDFSWQKAADQTLEVYKNLV